MSSSPLTSPGSDSKVTVLVVDDNAVNLTVACAMLARIGYLFEVAVDGYEGVAAVARTHAAGRSFGAVLMDVNMPRMNGLQATQKIHDLLGPASPAIIGLTAGASTEDLARCMDAGMDDYLTKPLYVSSLMQTLQRWLNPGEVRTMNSEGRRPERVRDDAAAPEPALMDFDRLAQFREFDDEALSTTRQVIALFRTDTALRLDAIEHAILSHDVKKLSWACHALIGAAGNMGAVAMQSKTADLDAHAKGGVVPANAMLELERLRACWNSTLVVLGAWMLRAG